MKTAVLFVNKEYRFSLEQSVEDGRYYFALNVNNGYIDYDEYYLLTEEQCKTFSDNENDAIRFAFSCARHEQDGLLKMLPGNCRGVWSYAKFES